MMSSTEYRLNLRRLEHTIGVQMARAAWDALERDLHQELTPRRSRAFERLALLLLAVLAVVLLAVALMRYL